MEAPVRALPHPFETTRTAGSRARAKVVRMLMKDLEVRVELLLQVRFRRRADHLIDELASLEEDPALTAYFKTLHASFFFPK